MRDCKHPFHRWQSAPHITYTTHAGGGWEGQGYMCPSCHMRTLDRVDESTGKSVLTPQNAPETKHGWDLMGLCREVWEELVWRAGNAIPHVRRRRETSWRLEEERQKALLEEIFPAGWDKDGDA